MTEILDITVSTYEQAREELIEVVLAEGHRVGPLELRLEHDVRAHELPQHALGSPHRVA